MKSERRIVTAAARLAVESAVYVRSNVPDAMLDNASVRLDSRTHNDSLTRRIQQELYHEK
jgi:hypothetical protein